MLVEVLLVTTWLAVGFWGAWEVDKRLGLDAGRVLYLIMLGPVSACWGLGYRLLANRRKR